MCGINAATTTATAMHGFKCREIEAGRGAGCPMSVADASAKESAGRGRVVGAGITKKKTQKCRKTDAEANAGMSKGLQKHASAKAAISVSDAETGADANTSEGANAESAGAVFADADDVQMQTS